MRLLSLLVVPVVVDNLIVVILYVGIFHLIKTFLHIILKASLLLLHFNLPDKLSKVLLIILIMFISLFVVLQGLLDLSNLLDLGQQLAPIFQFRLLL